MDYIRNILFVGLFLLSFCTNQAQDTVSLTDQIYGQWKYENHLWWEYGKYTQNEVDSFKCSILQISRDKIYFEDVIFVDSCSFSEASIKTSKLLDRTNEEYHWFEEGSVQLLPTRYTGPLVLQYSKKELKKIDKIDLGCGYDLSILYLKSDTLILNYLGGITLFMTKAHSKPK